MYNSNDSTHVQTFENTVKFLNNAENADKRAKTTLWKRGMEKVQNVAFLYFVTGAYSDGELSDKTSAAGQIREMLRENTSVQPAALNKLCDDARKFVAYTLKGNPKAEKETDFSDALKASGALNVNQLRRVMKGLPPKATAEEKKEADARAAKEAAKTIVSDTLNVVKDKMTEAQRAEFLGKIADLYWDVLAPQVSETAGTDVGQDQESAAA